MSKVVVYTAIFGGYDFLYEPTVKPNNVDYVCFTDSKDMKSDTWDIRYTLPLYNNPELKNPAVRNARKYKALPHRFLPEYEYSVWVDGNAQCRGDVNELIGKYLWDNNESSDGGQTGAVIPAHSTPKPNMAVYDKMSCTLDPWNCIYEEARRIFQFGAKNLEREPWKGIKAYKDDPKLIQKQTDKYMRENFPPNLGLLSAMVLVRRHNEADVKKVGEEWWEEMKYYSHLDQMSFNYVAWKNRLNFNWIKEDVRECRHFQHKGIHKVKLNEK
jgi:hypothetical protein